MKSPFPGMDPYIEAHGHLWEDFHHHLIEDIAADYFGFQVSNFQVDELARDAAMLPIADANATRDLDKTASKILGLSDQFWVRFTQARYEGRFPLHTDLFAQRTAGG